MQKLLFFFILLPFWAGAQTAAPKQPAKNVTIVCHFVERPSYVDSFFLYETIGLGNRVVSRSSLRTSDSTFILTVPASSVPRMYVLGSKNMPLTAKVWIADEPEMNFWANFNYLDKGRTVGSAVNRNWEGVQKRIDAFRATADDLNAKYRMGTAEKKEMSSLVAGIESLNKSQKQYIDSLKAANNPFWKLAAIHIWPVYKGDKGFEDAGDFMSRESFRYTNLSDTYYNDQPEVFAAFDQLSRRLGMVLITTERMQKLMDAQLAKVPENSKAYRMAMGGTIAGMKSLGHVLSNTYSVKYADKYRNADLYGEIKPMEYESAKSRTSTIGMEAPDLAGNTPDNGTYSLSQLRGKITLIDFWASWCAPCRRENPNVVKVYNKYHSKGFDILGVSLDQDADRWREAIQKDGLPWHHISDLGGWQSKHAALYSVQSIPTTVLVDKDGKILARNLRGEQLEMKLKEIFGE